jgi:uncharacterized membrane protein
MLENGYNSSIYDLISAQSANDSALKYKYINAHINNISFPKTIDELETFIYDHGCYNVEDVILTMLMSTWTI